MPLQSSAISAKKKSLSLNRQYSFIFSFSFILFYPPHTHTTTCAAARPGRQAPHTHPHPHHQEVTTYLTDFIDLSNLLAALLPGDSFLLRRKANRFFMSLALSERKIERKKGRNGKREKKKKTRHGEEAVLSVQRPTSSQNNPNQRQRISSVNPIHMISNPQRTQTF